MCKKSTALSHCFYLESWSVLIPSTLMFLVWFLLMSIYIFCKTLSLWTKKNGPIPASFCLFSLFSLYNYNNTILKKSVDGELGILTRGCRMVGADETTDLWRPPSAVRRCGDLMRTPETPGSNPVIDNLKEFLFHINCKDNIKRGRVCPYMLSGGL